MVEVVVEGRVLEVVVRDEEEGYALAKSSLVPKGLADLHALLLVSKAMHADGVAGFFYKTIVSFCTQK